ncbi:MAG: aldo/keto reductase [Lapillicoccus sp.]
MRYVESVPTTKKISVIGLGTWQFGSSEWGYGDAYAEAGCATIVRRALELGVTLFDTAEIYGYGRSERILGAALGDSASDAFIATKVFPLLPTAPVVEQRAVASANRLGVDHLDLYQVHQPNPLIRDRTTMRGMAALRTVGLVGEVGVSNYSLGRWQEAEAALGGRVLSNQVQYSLVDRRPEHDLLPWAEATGRLVIAYSPLGQGLLSGRYDAEHLPANGVRRLNPIFLPENLRRATGLVTTLREVADAHDASPAQIALAWLVHHPHVVAIPGASSVAQLESNAAAADIALADDEYAALSAASDRLDLLSGVRTLGPLARKLAGRTS